MMTRQPWVRLVVALLLVLVVGFTGSADPPEASKPPGEGFTGKAIRVRILGDRNGDGAALLLDPEIRTLGQRTFLTGRPVDMPTRPARLWVPLEDVRQIEEFTTAEELAKWYRVPPPPK